MCGLAGAIGEVDPAVHDAVARANNRMRHRGPDGDGIWTSFNGASREKGAVLAHRRLAIIDLTPSGRQPMVDPESGNVIVYNGEVYNHLDLRRDLERSGERFVSRCDTEVILRACRVWGDTCVERFRGMFAFAIWDETNRRVFLARDRLGIKPLYVANADRKGGNVTFFASELRALLETGFISAKLDPVSLSGYVWHGFVVGPGTMVRGVKLLPAGTTLTLSADAPDASAPGRRYWRLPRTNAGSTTVEQVDDVLETSVQVRLMSEVPLGVFLSGGVDSSAIAVAAARLCASKISTFNVCFDEPEFDESAHARRVAESIGAEHAELRLTRTDFAEQLDDALASLDQPTFDGLNTYFVSRAVRQAGITVALAGVGGDELFGGYRSFRDLPRLVNFGGLLYRIPKSLRNPLLNSLGRMACWSFGDIPPQVRWGKLADIADTGGDLVKLYQVAYALFTSTFHRQLLQFPSRDELSYGLSANQIGDLTREIAGDLPLPAISHLELRSFVGERLLRDVDTASMANSLEVRVPLLDHEFIAAVAGLSEQDRFMPLGAKKVLRNSAERKVPRDVFARPKSGFVLPIERWARSVTSDNIRKLFADHELVSAVGLNPRTVAQLWEAHERETPGMYWSRVWSLFALLWWCRRYGVFIS